MSLFGAIFTGVSGLSGESQATAMIANNIANTNTIGFKRSEAAFFSLVTTQSRSSEFSPGTVSVSRVQRIDQQGPLQQTSSSTDAAVSGNGFFPVKRSASSDQEFLYTRAGSFSEDEQGLLRNTANFVLYAWPIDQNGSLPDNQGDLSSLVPADVSFLGGLTRPTTSADIAINLDADERDLQTVNNGATAATGNALPVSASQEPSFSRGLTVFDSLGSGQTMTFEFRKITGPMANLTSQTGVSMEPDSVVIDELTDISDGDTITLTTSNGVNTLTLEFDNDSAVGAGNTQVVTMQDMIEAINNFDFGPGSDGLTAQLDANGQLRIQAVHLQENFTVANGSGAGNGPIDSGTGSFNFATNPNASITAQFTDIDATYPANDQSAASPTFPAFVDNQTPNSQGWWELKILKPDGVVHTQGLLNFDTDGTLNASPDENGQIDVNLQNINFNNGSDPTQDISVDISRFNQFAGNYNVIFSDQNGAELGLRTGVEITREGIITARFSNGATTDLYQIPLVTFANANGLNEESGTAFAETSDSGEENLRVPGSGGAGFFEPSTVEGSNVDLADEFARMIVSQRTYSANSRLVNTVDQMTEELLRLR